MKKFIPLASMLAIPALAFAQTLPNFTYIESAFNAGKGVLGGLINVLMIGAFLWFLWTVIGFITAKEDKDRTEKRKQMLWGIVGLFVMTSVWGIIGILRQTTQAGSGGTGSLTCPPGTTNVGNKCI
jgi:hypothetical protein